ncbi:hypothetical protein VA97_02840 [Salmonella enterica]|nr:hypothetical protein [Salmonella enterica]ECI2729378.1 hypothetical protein [Salmonella enterica subsp. enterica]EDN8426126.1 hypothetical protein [Salmonella enterica subsp. enterica]EDW2095067.1 hypothetical protein [Salmonella enterica subsp. enterica]EEC0903346.1 hypothetical protein [Salmonella enterica subsp. enterica]
MNKIFKVIWNPATGTFTVASETAKSRGKKSGRRKLLASALLVTSGMLASFGAGAVVGLDGGTSVEPTPAADDYWIAIGQGAQATATADGTSSIAIGLQSFSGSGSTALGYGSRASGEKSVSLGQISEATGDRAIAIGSGAHATESHSIAMGLSASSNAAESIALGNSATTKGVGAIAAGFNANANGLYSLALGYESSTTGQDSIAFGRNTASYGTGSIALGADSKAAKDYGVALGYSSDAYGTGTLAFGQNAAAGKSGGDILNAIAIGTDSLANNTNTLALGAKSNATGNNSISLGYNAITNGNNAVAIGANSVAGTDNTVSVGNNILKRKIVNVGAGAISDTSTDAINGSQLYSIGYSVAERFGGSLYGSTINGDGTLNAPTYSLKSGIYNNVGEALSGIDNDTLHWDDSKKAFSASYIVKNAAGEVIETKTENKIINVAAGDVSATSTDAVNGSQLNIVKNDVADLAEDALQWDANASAFSASHGTTATNKITNLAAGTVSDTSTDAVNGSQLYGASSSVVNALGGGSVVNADGSISAPTYSVAGSDYNNVGDALTAIDDDMNVMGDTVTDLAQDALQWDDNLKAYSAKHGAVDTNKITNVAAGDVSATSTDAVNGSQLNTVKTDVATNTTNITNLSTEIDGLSEDALKWNGTAFSASHDSATTNKITNVAAGDVSATSTDAVNGSQLNTVKTDVATNTTNITNLSTEIDGLSEDALKWNANAGAFSASHGTTATNKITNVAAGDVSATSTDAVNGSQLNTVKTDVATNTTNITNLSTEIDGLSEDALQWNANAGAFSASHGTTATNKITNLAAGTVSGTSTDAVNGSQLYGASSSVVNALGGGSVVNADGSISAPTYSVAGGDYNSVGDALTAIDDDMNVMGDTVTDLAQDALQWDDNLKAYSAKHGTVDTNKITNVAAGDVSATSTDAVNGSQLKTTNDAVATNTTNITNLSTEIDGLSEDALKWNGTDAFSASHGSATTNKITNVAAGDVSATSTDAVNGSQLKTTNDAVATNTTNITNLSTEIDGLSEDALQWNGTAFSASHGSVTTNKITNVAAGDINAKSTDAINGSQLYDLSGEIASYFGGGAAVSDTGEFTGPTYTIGSQDYTSVGDALDAINASFNTSLGDALLWDSNAGVFSASHGTSTTNKITNVAAGDINAKSTDAINGSQLYDLSGEIASYFGGGAAVSDTGEFTGPTYTIGSQDYTSVGDALDAINASFNTSLGDALLWDSNAGAFSASHGTSTTNKIINVANGDVNATSTDAVNGGQLYGVSNSVADALGGDATVNADGTISAPNYTIAGNSYNNVGDALEAIDDDALLWDEDKGAFNAAHGTETASRITNVADGDISATSKDAVNGSQLNTTNMMINQNTALINQLAGDTSTTYIEENGAGVNYIRTNDTNLAFNDASASGEGATAVGYNASASGNSSIAIGRDSSSTVDGSIALGSGSVSNRVITTGSANTSVTENGVIIGYDTTDGELLGALSVGKDGESYRQIINVADGTEAHDVVTVRQLQNAIGAVATTPTKYYHANSTAEDSLAVGEDSLAMGAKTVVNGNAGIGIGLNTLVLADAINGIAIGSNASANHANSIAMGNGSQTTRGAQTGYTAYNMDAPQNSVGEFSVGSEDGQRQITNVAAGSADTDAVNVGQLKITDERVAQNTQNISNLNNQIGSLDTRVTNIENSMGDIITTGSTKYFKTNSTGPDANAQGADSVAIGAGSIAAADNSVALGAGSVANEANTISVGSSDNQRRITNVAAGKNATDAVNVAQLKASEAGSVRYNTNEDGSVDYSNISLGDGKGGTTRISNVSAAVNDNDAVNYAQLKQSVQETTQYTDQRMAEMDHKLSKTESKLSGGIASAMAMTGLPQAYTPGASMASIGGGTYNGESAVALGVSMVSANGRWVYKLQGSTNSQGEYSAAIGAGIQW